MSFDAYTTAGQGQNLFQQLPIQSTRDPVNGVDFNDPTGGPYQIGRRWFNKINENYWHYVGHGTWVLDASSTGPILGIDVPAGASPIFPDAAGLVGFTSTGGTVTISGSNGGLGAQNINFDVTGAVVSEKFGVDASTPPGTNPVTPTGGLVTIEGGATYPTGTRANPIRTNSLAASTIDLQIQLAGSNAGSSTANNFGVSQYDSNQFGVTSGFVTFTGKTALFVPTLAFGGASVGIVYTVQEGEYNQIANMVFFTVRISTSSIGSSTGSATIGGLPVPVGGASSQVGIVQIDFVTFDANYNTTFLRPITASSTLGIFETGNGVTSVPITNSNLVNAITIRAQGFYFIS
jgi:hypothetical protein